MDSIWPQQDLDGNSCMFHRYLSEDNIADNSKIQIQKARIKIKLNIFGFNSSFLTAKEYFDILFGIL